MRCIACWIVAGLCECTRTLQQASDGGDKGCEGRVVRGLGPYLGYVAVQFVDMLSGSPAVALSPRTCQGVVPLWHGSGLSNTVKQSYLWLGCVCLFCMKGIEVLEAAGVRGSFLKAVAAAARRSKELSKVHEDQD